MALLPFVSKDDAATTKFFHTGSFDRTKVRADFVAKFASDPHYNSASTNDLEKLLGFMEVDSRVTDIRWMAYMLATAYWETSHLVKAEKVTINKKTHKPVTRQIKVWQNMSPVEESGHGKTAKGIKDYYLPVKVQRLLDGTAIVTEHDGDQWTVGINGVNKAATKGAKLGAAAAKPAAAGFTADGGTEHTYYGRGYVQLTWWTNYASTGAAIGEGLNLLFDPERALEPKTAYAVMARGMITGAGFANGHKLSDYFHGAYTNYPNARAMVNGTDHKADIAKIAQLFEDVLLHNKVGGSGSVAKSTTGTISGAY